MNRWQFVICCKSFLQLSFVVLIGWHALLWKLCAAGNGALNLYYELIKDFVYILTGQLFLISIAFDYICEYFTHSLPFWVQYLLLALDESHVSCRDSMAGRVKCWHFVNLIRCDSSVFYMVPETITVYWLWEFY